MTKSVKQVGILGVGSYLPSKILTNHDLEKMVDTSDEWIVQRTGIRTRHIAAPEQATSDMALIAARRALEDAGVAPADLDLIIVATATPDYGVYPSTACLVQDRLWATHAAAFDLSAGCTGFVYGVSVAAQMIASGVYKKALVIGAETLSRILNWEDRNTCVLFGDGAGAAVLGEVEEGYGILGLDLGSDGAGSIHLMQPSGGSRKPASHETVDAKEHTVHMNGNEVFKFAVKIMGKTAKKSLEQAGLTNEDIDMLVPHQANIRIIQSAAKHFKMPMDKVWVNIDKYSNTSAACIPIALTEMQDQHAMKKGDNLLLVAFGAGLTWGSIVLKWCK